MDKKTLKTMLMLGIILSIVGLASAENVTTKIQNTVSTILCVLIQLLIFIAGGIAIIIIVLNGIKWTASSDDPGARKQAKQGIIHAIVGLIIVLIAVFIVSLVVGSADSTAVILGEC